MKTLRELHDEWLAIRRKRYALIDAIGDKPTPEQQKQMHVAAAEDYAAWSAYARVANRNWNG